MYLGRMNSVVFDITLNAFCLVDCFFEMFEKSSKKIASLGRQEPQPAGTAKWQTTLRFGKILGTTSVVRSTERTHEMLYKRFTGHGFLQVVFIFCSPRSNYKSDIRLF